MRKNTKIKQQPSGLDDFFDQPAVPVAINSTKKTDPIDGWRKNSNGGYEQIDPVVDQWRKDCYAYRERVYILACYLYYQGPPDLESPLTDDQFDSIQLSLSHGDRFENCSPQFRKRIGSAKTIKTDAHSLKYTEQEKKDAVAWASGKLILTEPQINYNVPVSPPSSKRSLKA